MARGPGLYPMIDIANAATCLACPVPYGCVYEDRDAERRKLCPIWRRQSARETNWKRAAAERRAARKPAGLVQENQ